jgi:hypothetical protein
MTVRPTASAAPVVHDERDLLLPDPLLLDDLCDKPSHLGSGRIVPSETRAPSMLVNLV